MANTEKMPYFVIESGRPGYIKIDFSKSPQYADLLKQEKARTLPKTCSNPQVVSRAALHATEDMFIDTDVDPETYRETKSFKSDLIVCEADERGRIYIERDKPELARQVLRELRLIDPKVGLDPQGLMLPEEIPEDQRKPVNKGGRGRTNAKFLGGDNR